MNIPKLNDLHPFPNDPRESDAGRSPDAGAIYKKYLNYYSTINNYITQINTKYPHNTIPPYAETDLTELRNSLAPLGVIYQKDYANPQKTLAGFEEDCATIMSNALNAYDDAIGSGSSIHDQINADYTKAQNIVTTITTTLSSASTTINQITSAIQTFTKTLTSLDAKIAALPSGSQKTKAQADYKTAQTALSQLQTDLTNVQNQVGALQTLSDSLSTPLSQLQTLSQLTNPTQDNLTTANGIITNSFSPAQTALTNLNSALQTIMNDKQSVSNAIIKVQEDLNIKPPTGNVEHGCWYIDWTSWFSGNIPIPEGVTTINIFVGTLKDSSGGIGGFGNLSNDQIPAFVATAKANGVETIKISIGGGNGGAYDNTWDNVTEDNYETIAQTLVNFCEQYQLDGVDFDYEEFKVSQEPLIGKLIAAFKAQSPNLQASLCANAGFSTWQPHVKRILDETVDDSGASCLDRLYVMSYYNSFADETAWLQQWATWINETYQMDSSKLGVGVDDFDAHAYNPTQLKQWADQNGFSWCHWAYDPSQASQRNVVDAHMKRRYTLIEGIITNKLIEVITLILKASLFPLLFPLSVLFNNSKSKQRLYPEKDVKVLPSFSEKMPTPSAPPETDTTEPKPSAPPIKV